MNPTVPGSLSLALARLTAEAASREFEITVLASQTMVAVPPDPALGDLSTAVCLRLARELRARPVELAGRLAARLESQLPEGVSRVTVTPPGYVNFFLDPLQLSGALASGRYRTPLVSRLGEVELETDARVAIEHTNINPNKSAHIGHLRNACLGDSVARLLRASGLRVEVQNYIDDTGTAVADIVVGLDTMPDRPGPDDRFDDFCWDLYARVNQRYEAEPEFLAERRRVLFQIEQGENATSRLAADVSARIVTYHLDTMASVAVDYDLLTWESHILGLRLWEHCCDLLVRSGGLIREDQGANAGCLVVPLGDHPAFAQLENPDKVLVRSDGTATYTAKDIAYQLWKFGLAGRDFGYRRRHIQWSGRQLWTTTLDTDADDDSPGFGRADVVLNVIDVRQSYLQDILVACLERLGFGDAARNSIHFAYELVVLSDRAARELGLDPEGESVAMSGRKGVGIKAHELIDRARDLARTEVVSRHPDWDAERIERTAAAIAAGAIRYYMIRFRTSVVLAFDFAEALNLFGKTGPYLQYAYARGCRILDRAAGDESEPGSDDVNDSERRLVRLLALSTRRMEEAAEKLEVSILAEHTYELASAFMGFYEESPVLSAPDPVRGRRLRLVRLFIDMMSAALGSLGIPTLSEM